MMIPYFNAYRIGPCLFMSGLIDVGTRTRGTSIIQLPGDLKFAYNPDASAGMQFQYNFWHSFDSIHAPLILENQRSVVLLMLRLC